MSQVSHVSEVSRDRGNTRNPVPRRNRSRRWCFTVNNPSDEDRLSLTAVIATCQRYIYGNEVGDQGTPHIQGYLEFKNQKTLGPLKSLLPRAHWEKAKGTPEQNWDYCSKEGDFTSNFSKKLTREDLKQQCLEEYKNVTWKPWQAEAIKYADECSSTRLVHWFWEPTGNTGKSFLAKYLCLREGTIICQGKREAICHQVNISIESGIKPRVAIVDVPRVSKDFISYSAIEQLKNGCLYSSKYEGGVCLFTSPVVICFANCPPDFSKLSEDRWNVIEI